MNATIELHPTHAATEAWTLTGPTGAHLTALTYGGIVTKFWGQDAAGNAANVLISHNSLKEHLTHDRYHGAIVGRITRVAFTLDCATYRLATDNSSQPPHARLLW